MSFISLGVLLWLTAAISASWLAPRRLQPYAAGACGVLFLGVYAPLSLGILAIGAAATYALCGRGRPRGTVLTLIVLFMAGVFSCFKLRVASGGGGDAGAGAIMPLGLSYYTFRMVHYCFEQYKGRLRPHRFGEYLCYLFLMPPLVIGPIHRFPEFLTDLRRRRWEWDRFSLGLERAFHGYAKLIIVANFLIASRLQRLYGGFFGENPDLLGQFAWAALMWLDLYVRFSACTDIAAGAAAMMGFRIMENFNYPFLAVNISDFWRRWHISLTSWCRDYVFAPVAAVTRRPLIAVIATMLIIGLWHEFSIRYILWGVYHALGIVCHQRWRRFRERYPQPRHPVLRGAEKAGAVILTLLFVISSYMVTSMAQDALTRMAKGVF